MATTKAPRKKAAPKKTVRTARARTVRTHVRHEARDGESFWVYNGPVCSTIAQLRAAIASMTDEQFAYHTQRSGNDFAAWMECSMEHPKCAARLAKARTRAGALRAIAICEDC
jgi:hypothetical protein